ncbi:hypothetical protein GGP41_010122 [Bipolaris sorokiniana]|uniref:Cyanovirin-N domain-containing protein n=1 Tax=Cochliobolus sativus TaxID=45130 RepID=A0A8H5ZIN7_COCSA|nr:hypothetical protein GGP41_010122 [Bipolaris sorokiniana]
MHSITTLFTAVLALLPSVQADIPHGNWMQLDCYLTAQACNKNYVFSVCIAYISDGLNDADLWENCKKQSQNGWYDIDRITGDVVVNGSPYKAYDAEGRGY